MQSTTNNDDRDQTEPQVIHREINSQLRRNKAKKNAPKRWCGI